MTLTELEIAISVEITKINATYHAQENGKVIADARVDALEWVLGMIKVPDSEAEHIDEAVNKARVCHESPAIALLGCLFAAKALIEDGVAETMDDWAEMNLMSAIMMLADVMDKLL